MTVPARGRVVAPAVPVIGALALALAAPAPARAQPFPAAPDSLSLEEAVGIAAGNNPAFLQQRNDLDVARSAARASRGELLPSASVSTGFGYTASGERRFGSVEFGEQPDYYSSDYSLNLSYRLSGATLLQPAVERSRVRATERQVGGAQAGLEAQVKQQYLAVLRAHEQVAQAEQEVARTEEHRKLAQARLEVGAGIPLDVRRAEVQKGRAEVSLVQARSAAATEALRLGQLLGVTLDPDVVLTSRFSIFDPAWSADSLVAVALQNNPALLASRADEDAAATAVKSARTAYLPSLSFNVGVVGSAYQAGNIDPLIDESLFGLQGAFRNCQSQNELRLRVGLAPEPCINPADPAVQAEVRDRISAQNRSFPFDYTRQPVNASLSISLPIFQGFSRQLQVDQAKAARADAQYQVRAEELRLRQEVSAAVLSLETQFQTVRLQEQVRANATEELRLAQERFRFGAAGSVEVTDAQTTLAQAERDLIGAVYDFHQSLATLEALVGRPLR